MWIAMLERHYKQIQINEAVDAVLMLLFNISSWMNKWRVTLAESKTFFHWIGNIKGSLQCNLGKFEGKALTNLWKMMSSGRHNEMVAFFYYLPLQHSLVLNLIKSLELVQWNPLMLLLNGAAEPFHYYLYMMHFLLRAEMEFSHVYW